MMTGVRIAALKEKAAAMRRRPVQSRAYASSQALQEAFVRVLIEQGFEKTTVREVTAVAGVGIGTFYDYFGNMDALAALCIHRCIKALALAATVAAEQADRRLLAIAHSVADTYALSITGELKTWVALFRLERQISTPKAFHKQYAAHVEMWRSALARATDPPADVGAAARMLHCITYGWLSQSLIAKGSQVSTNALIRELRDAIDAYLGGLPCRRARRRRPRE
jgi:AcrR family transcriptional regulator